MFTLNRTQQHLFLTSVALGLAARLLWLTWQYSTNLLFWDQWDVYTPFLTGGNLIDFFFRQQGMHRQGLAALLMLPLAYMTNLNTRYESITIALVMIAAMGLALWLKRRLHGQLEWRDGLIPLMFLTPVQMEAFVAAPNMAPQILPVFLAMMYALIWLELKQPWHYVGLLIFNWLAIYTGYAIFLGCITILLLTLELFHHWRKQLVRQLTMLAVAVASLAGFFLIDYHFDPAVECFQFPHPRPWEYAQFMGLGLANFFNLRLQSEPYSGLTTLLGLGILTVVVIHFAYHLKQIALNPPFAPLSLVSVILSGFTLIYLLNTAIGRVCEGVAIAQSSRYMPMVVPLLLTLYLQPLPTPKPRLAWQGLLAVGLLASHLFIPFNIQLTLTRLNMNKRAWVNCYLTLHDSEKCNQITWFMPYPHPTATHLDDKLAYMETHHLNLFQEQPTPPPSPTEPLTLPYQLTDQLVLVALEPQSHDRQVSVELTWLLYLFPNNPGYPYSVYVHLLDNTGQRVAGSDVLLGRDGSRRVEPDYVATTHQFELPAELPPGVYQVQIGAYYQADGQIVSLQSVVIPQLIRKE